ncbi:MAG: serine/threonine-protein kinase, partial [Acidobacteriota bacterium]|nr:serine/threonine-protein kinase [Acidobacteriota bacterium]
MPTRTLGRYRIERELGRGSMGQVFLAYDPDIQRRVAIKTISIFASLPEDERADARARFLREIRAAGRLLHPGIITVFDVGEERGLPYLAMEYVQGQTLDQFCKQDRLLPVKSVVEAIARASEALDFAHASGVVHRDIKPANILRTGDASIKIMDFGLAKGPHANLTQDGALLGTPAYMSPEQIRGEVVDGRSDLFSLGVVLYEMLTGEKPFGGESVSSVLYRIVHEEPRNASMVDARVPASLAAFLDRAMAKEIEDRFQTGAEFAQALREAGGRIAGAEEGPEPVIAETPIPITVPETSIPAPPTRKRSSLVPWIALAAVVIGGAATVYVLRLHERWLPWLATPPPDFLEARVRTEPPGLAVLLDGEPIEGAVVRFPVQSPFGVLTTTEGCRTAEHSLDAADAGTEIVLVTDPAETEVEIDPGVAGAGVRLNGADAGAAPAGVLLDLCRDNKIEIQAEGYTPASVELTAGTGV